MVDQSAAEGRCLVLRTPTAAYLLVGDTTTLVAGQRATLTGRLTPTLRTTCQLGVPFRVERVERVETAGQPAPGYQPR